MQACIIVLLVAIDSFGTILPNFYRAHTNNTAIWRNLLGIHVQCTIVLKTYNNCKKNMRDRKKREDLHNCKDTPKKNMVQQP